MEELVCKERSVLSGLRRQVMGSHDGARVENDIDLNIGGDLLAGFLDKLGLRAPFIKADLHLAPVQVGAGAGIYCTEVVTLVYKI